MELKKVKISPIIFNLAMFLPSNIYTAFPQYYRISCFNTTFIISTVISTHVVRNWEHFLFHLSCTFCFPTVLIYSSHNAVNVHIDGSVSLTVPCNTLDPFSFSTCLKLLYYKDQHYVCWVMSCWAGAGRSVSDSLDFTIKCAVRRR